MKISLLRRKEENVLVLVESKIAGKGILAKEDIRRGSRIIEYKGKIRKCSAKDAIDPYVCLMDLDDDYVIDPRKAGNLARFINHSCEPNCELVRIGNRIYIESIKSIKALEELTYDYNLNLSGWKEGELEAQEQLYGCLCGSKKCRGTMLGKK